jgi:hypothetical protein
LANLKKTLRPFYKRAAKEVMRKQQELNQIRENSVSLYPKLWNQGKGTEQAQ